MWSLRMKPEREDSDKMGPCWLFCYRPWRAPLTHLYIGITIVSATWEIMCAPLRVDT